MTRTLYLEMYHYAQYIMFCQNVAFLNCIEVTEALIEKYGEEMESKFYKVLFGEMEITCPRCDNEDIGEHDNYCKICGLRLIK